VKNIFPIAFTPGGTFGRGDRNQPAERHRELASVSFPSLRHEPDLLSAVTKFRFVNHSESGAQRGGGAANAGAQPRATAIDRPGSAARIVVGTSRKAQESRPRCGAARRQLPAYPLPSGLSQWWDIPCATLARGAGQLSSSHGWDVHRKVWRQVGRSDADSAIVKSLALPRHALGIDHVIGAFDVHDLRP